jgi:outer membrane lipoprotein SlyB
MMKAPADIPWNTVLAGVALVIMGLLSGALVFHAVPQGNQQLVTFALGAISGALTVSGASKAADKITTNTADTLTVNKDASNA